MHDTLKFHFDKFSIVRINLDWKYAFISKGGQDMLIQVTLASLPTYLFIFV